MKAFLLVLSCMWAAATADYTTLVPTASITASVSLPTGTSTIIEMDFSTEPTYQSITAMIRSLFPDESIVDWTPSTVTEITNALTAPASTIVDMSIPASTIVASMTDDVSIPASTIVDISVPASTIVDISVPASTIVAPMTDDVTAPASTLVSMSMPASTLPVILTDSIVVASSAVALVSTA